MIPSVDRLVLTSVVDGTYLAILPDRQFGHLSVERTRRPRAPSLRAEHGLAYHLASARGGEQRQILVDFGLTIQSLQTNLQLLGIELTEAEALVLSHGHGDHYGGLLALADAMPIWAERGIPLYVGGEDTFCRRWTVDARGQRVRSEQLARSGVEARGLRVIVAKEPTVVGGHLMLSGQIPRVTDFETGLANARVEVGVPGTDCADALRLLRDETDAQPVDLIADHFAGETAAIYNVRERGLVVISSCGHAGIINTVRHAQRATGIERIHAVVGGWHLADATENVIGCTVSALVDLAPDYFIPMHCTGFSTMARLEQALPGRVVEPSVGTRVVFGM